jgi:2-keto-4-pentenoate hydratase/2-oxohepta-3-ene-1,7-dioic acid hydratase in catechol pathway
LQFQGELVIITSKTAKNISLEDAHKYILGYTVGNDLTARVWHAPERSSIQLGYSKGFDNFAPMGPSLISHEAYKVSSSTALKTWVNGDLVQDASVEEMVFNAEEIVSFLSQGS